MAASAIGGVGQRPAARDRRRRGLGLGLTKAERSAQNQGCENRPRSILPFLHQSLSRSAAV